MITTPVFGFPQPEGTDLISQGYDAIGDLALAVEGVLAPGLPRVTIHNYGASGSLAAATVAGAKKLLVRCLGGGGAGGGATATTAAQNSFGGGGQAGTYAEALLDVAALTFPLAVTVGAAGVPVGGAAGGAGGLSRVRDNNGAGAVLCEAAGGEGGSTATGAAGTTAPGGRAGVAGVGHLVCPGAPGGHGLVVVFEYAQPGQGGSSVFGGGGSTLSGVGNLQGQGGLAYGAGGAGSARRASNAALAGGAGVVGLVQFLAFY